VVAGPGSGKTRVLTARAAHLILAGGAQPWQLMCITFTNKVRRQAGLSYTPRAHNDLHAHGQAAAT
jgi:superfamily I DNA/RNA helicase